MNPLPRIILPLALMGSFVLMAGTAFADARAFSQPRILGQVVDRCLEGSVQCGKPAADAFCRRLGYASALSYRIERDPARIATTIAIDSNLTIRAPAAQPFQMVKCWRPNEQPSTVRFDIDNLASPTTCDFGQDCRKAAADQWCAGKGYALGALGYEVNPNTPRFRTISCATL
jgi:hypothetical protein